MTSFTNEGCANCYLEGYDCTYPEKKVPNCEIYEKYLKDSGYCMTCQGAKFDMSNPELNPLPKCPACNGTGKIIVVNEQ